MNLSTSTVAVRIAIVPNSINILRTTLPEMVIRLCTVILVHIGLVGGSTLVEVDNDRAIVSRRGVQDFTVQKAMVEHPGITCTAHHEACASFIGNPDS